MGFRRHKTAPKVRNGKVQYKNRHEPTPRYRGLNKTPIIDRERAGYGYQHLISKKQLFQFIEIIPNWNELSKGLEVILLAAGNSEAMGWYNHGFIALSAWDSTIQREWDQDFVEEHIEILNRLGVELEEGSEDDTLLCLFDRVSARGFQLMHVFLHELGHHHDRMTTRSRRECSRGEDYAEDYANEYAERLWDQYFDVFGW